MKIQKSSDCPSSFVSLGVPALTQIQRRYFEKYLGGTFKPRVRVQLQARVFSRLQERVFSRLQERVFSITRKSLSIRKCLSDRVLSY